MSKSVRQLDQIRIAAPCDAAWDSMIGNDQVRFCEHCNLHVNNLSAMTRSEALRLVARSRGRICVRFTENPFGGPLTGKLPEKLYGIGRRTSRLAAGAFSAALSVTTATAQSSPSAADAASAAGYEKLQTAVEKQQTAVSDSLIDEFTGVVAGTVKNSEGVPISEATVVLVDRESGEERSTTTSAKGDYSFQGLAGGDYLIWARKPRFVSASDTAKLKTNSRLQIDLEINEGLRVRATGGVMMALERSENPLAKAVSENDLATVKALAFTTPNLSSIQTTADVGLLAEAVGQGNREIVEVLLFAGADVNTRSRNGRTALMSVSEKTSVEIVRDLLAYGANINARDDYGDNATIIAAEASTVEVLKELISAGAKIDATNSGGQNALFGAARNNVEAVNLLIKLGANPNVRDEDGDTALMSMAAYGEIETFQTLVDKGADMNVVDYEGRTTLMAAVFNENPAIAELLVRLAANVDAAASDGTTALMIAAENDRPKALSLLIAAGAKVNAKDADGLTALLRVAPVASEEIVRTLLDAGADMTVKDQEGSTPLALARERDNDKVVNLLKSRGARE